MHVHTHAHVPRHTRTHTYTHTNMQYLLLSQGNKDSRKRLYITLYLYCLSCSLLIEGYLVVLLFVHLL
jgi:hypothetical protein